MVRSKVTASVNCGRGDFECWVRERKLVGIERALLFHAEFSQSRWHYDKDSLSAEGSQHGVRESCRKD